MIRYSNIIGRYVFTCCKQEMKCVRSLFTLYIQLQSITFSLVSSKTILPTIHNDNAEFLSVICPITDIVPGYAYANVCIFTQTRVICFWVINYISYIYRPDYFACSYLTSASIKYPCNISEWNSKQIIRKHNLI